METTTAVKEFKIVIIDFVLYLYSNLNLDKVKFKINVKYYPKIIR